MPKVNLNATYGYRDPATGERRYYGPGQGIEAPQGLVDTLGLEVVAAPAEAEQAQPDGTPLPDEFPGRKFLVQAGHTTLESVGALSIDALIEIKGIGTRLAEAILKEVENA